MLAELSVATDGDGDPSVEAPSLPPRRLDPVPTSLGSERGGNTI
jgi:hypothetical protein